MANGTDYAELQICYSANAEDMLLERRCLVENDTRAAGEQMEKKKYRLD